MSTDDLMAEFHAALDDEIKEARQGRGQRFNLHDGRRLAAAQGAFLYQFLADFEVFVPDDSPIELLVGAGPVKGAIVAVEGLVVCLEVENDLGEEVPRAQLRSQPWYLLEELKARLDEIAAPDSRRNEALALKVLGRQPASVGSDEVSAAEALKEVARSGNAAQLRAVAAALASEVAFVWGPPGTGKTWTLGLIGRALHAAGETVLVTSHSNAAVDVAIRSLATAMAGTRDLEEGRIVRFGTPRLPEDQVPASVLPRQILRRQYPELIRAIDRAEAESRRMSDELRRAAAGRGRDALHARLRQSRERLAALRQEFREREAELIRAANIVACTLSKAAIAPEIHGRSFDSVAVDEASMAYVPQVYFAASLARARCVVLGDFRQLPPVALATGEAATRWLRRDVFDHAGIVARVDAGRPDPRLCLLDTQYRMHPTISSVINRLAYGGRLRDAPDIRSSTEPIAARPPYPGMALSFCDIGALAPQAYREPREQGFSHVNPFSAAVTVSLVQHILNGGTEQVGIICPYAAQAKLVRRIAHDLGLGDRMFPATVHRFQGWEREVVVFDIVDSAPLRQLGIMLRARGQGDALRLLNVAMSRSKEKLILVGDLGYLRARCEPSSPFGSVLAEVEAGGVRRVATPDLLTGTVSAPKAAGELRWYAEPREAFRDLERDILSARKELIVNWPDPDLDDILSDEMLPALRHRGVDVMVSTVASPRSTLIARRHSIRVVQELLAREAWVSIDRAVMWVGGPTGSFGRSRPTLRIGVRAAATLLAEIGPLARLASDRSPADPNDGLGRCVCGGVMWIDTGPYGPYVRCPSCRLPQRMRADHATRFSCLSGIRCERCNGEAVGRQGPRGVFLGCERYPRCTWTADLRHYV